MSHKQDGGPAFPLPGGFNQGMTLRDYFAAKAMQAKIAGFSASPDGHNWSHKDFAVDAYQMADAMLEARQS